MLTRVGRLGHRPALDGLRGLAILGVVLYHLTGGTGGWLGVNLFFVLSGFLITTLLLEERERTGRVSLWAFYTRRFFRLAPALVAAVVGFLAVSQFRHDINFEHPWRSSLIALASSTNIADAYNLEGVAPAISHTWSLGLEDQFYLLWPPLLLLLLTRWRRGVAAVVVASLAMFVLGNCLYVIAEHGPSLRTGFAPDTASYPILIGCFAALIAGTGVVRRFQAHEHAPLYDVLAGAVILTCLLTGFHTRQPELGQAANVAFALVVAGLLLRIASSGRTRTGWLRSRPLVWLGRISYSLYLWHVIVLDVAPFSVPIANVALAVAVAALSYRFIEQPFRQGRTRAPAAPPTVPQPATG